MWYGWHWRNGTWHRMVTGHTVAECSDALDAAVGRERDNLKLGLTAGDPPRWTPTAEAYLRRLPRKPPDG